MQMGTGQAEGEGAVTPPLKVPAPIGAIIMPYLPALAGLSFDYSRGGADTSFKILGAIVALGLVMRMRQQMVIDDHGVTVNRKRTVAWADIRGFTPGPGFLSGTIVVNNGKPMHAAAPCSWWGGPASADQLAALEARRPGPRPAPVESYAAKHAAEL
jgi:hypothetical protein